MEIEKYDRKPFSVMAVQVRFDNIHDIAKWCKGTLITQKTRMLGVETEVPAIKVEGQGDNRGKSFIASLGCYVVELKGSFRVYKPAQFDSSFVKAEQLVGETVLDKALQEAQEPIDPKLDATFVSGLEDDNSSADGQETAFVRFA